MKPGKQPVILQILPALEAGGAEQGCIDIAKALVDCGAKSLVVSNGGMRIHDLARTGSLHIEHPVHSKNPITMMNNVSRLKTIIREHDVDIVHARSRAPAWSALLACQSTGARFMTTCHAPYNISGGSKRFYNSSIIKGERVIAISRFIADYMLRNYKMDKNAVRVIHRGIALEKFHPTTVTPERLINLSREWRISDGDNVVLLPGRITRWKGHSVLIEAIARLNRPDVVCVMIGSDQGRKEYHQELMDMIQDKGLEGRVRIVDHCQDMPAAYMLSTVVVSASTDPEGFGRVPVEAQAMGRPTIATDHGGAQETIIRGETGWLVPPKDPAALASSIQEALHLDPTQRAILATRAMAHIAKNFTRESMIMQTLRVYEELLGSNALLQGFEQTQNPMQNYQSSPLQAQPNPHSFIQAAE